MKTIATIALALVLMGSAFAKQKPVYDLTGTASFSSFHSDSEAHMTVDGQRYDAYCSTNSTSIDCSDSAGVFEVKLADGKTYTYFVLDEFPTTEFGGHATLPNGTFQYRLDHYYTGGSKPPAVCVPVVNDKGKSKEVCYAILGVK